MVRTRSVNEKEHNTHTHTSIAVVVDVDPEDVENRGGERKQGGKRKALRAQSSKSYSPLSRRNQRFSLLASLNPPWKRECVSFGKRFS